MVIGTVRDILGLLHENLRCDADRRWEMMEMMKHSVSSHEPNMEDLLSRTGLIKDNSNIDFL